PSLHCLRRPSLALVRLLRGYYAAVRLPVAVPEGPTAPRVLLPAHRVALGATTGSPGSRACSFSSCFGVWDSAGPLRTRASARRRVAFWRPATRGVPDR